MKKLSFAFLCFSISVFSNAQVQPPAFSMNFEFTDPFATGAMISDFQKGCVQSTGAGYYCLGSMDDKFGFPNILFMNSDPTRGNHYMMTCEGFGSAGKTVLGVNHYFDEFWKSQIVFYAHNRFSSPQPSPTGGDVELDLYIGSTFIETFTIKAISGWQAFTSQPIPHFSGYDTSMVTLRQRNAGPYQDFAIDNFSINSFDQYDMASRAIHWDGWNLMDPHVTAAEGENYLIAGSTVLGATNAEVYAVKFSRENEVIWSNRYQVARSSDARCYGLDYNSITKTYFMTGYYLDAQDNYRKCYVLEIDEDGQVLRTKSIIIPGFRERHLIGLDVTVDSFGNILVGGYYDDSPYGLSHSYTASTKAGFVFKLDADLNLTWSKELKALGLPCGTHPDEKFTAINEIVEVPGGYFLSGSLSEHVTYTGGGTDIAQVALSRKVDYNGNPLWESSFQNYPACTIFSSFDPHDNTVSAGSVYEDGMIIQVSNNTQHHGIVVRTVDAASGAVLHEYVYDISDLVNYNDYAYSIMIDVTHDKSVVIAGYKNGSGDHGIFSINYTNGVKNWGASYKPQMDYAHYATFGNTDDRLVPIGLTGRALINYPQMLLYSPMVGYFTPLGNIILAANRADGPGYPIGVDVYALNDVGRKAIKSDCPEVFGASQYEGFTSYGRESDLGRLDLQAFSVNTTKDSPEAFWFGCENKMFLSAKTYLSSVTNARQPALEGLTVYPNPNSSRTLTIDVSGIDAEIGEIQLYSLSGERVFSREAEASTDPVGLELPGLSPGVYTLKVLDAHTQLIRVEKVVFY